MIPGFIDVHQHVIGGGGEAGFISRTPEAHLSQIVKAGITSLVGILGTDSVGRDIKALYAKVKVCKCIFVFEITSFLIFL
jgi:beta-aspartyl-dipeptidase (metallo-type)